MSSSNAINYSGASYAKARPTYHPQIYSLIYRFHQGGHELAVDVGTGTGQVAVELSKTFKKVYGLDPLEEQVNHGLARDNIVYQVGSAEDLSRFQDHSVDMVTVATAFHWFDHSAFFREVKRVLKRETGTLAVFGYFFPVIQDQPEATRLLKELQEGDFDRYANQNIRFMRNLYRDITFPFSCQQWYITPASEDKTHLSEPLDCSLMSNSMSLQELGNYLKTASPYNNYMNDPENKGKQDPVDQLMDNIVQVMQVKDKNTVVNLEWPTVLVLARND
ncbi:S-adenosyl-L-methionine-dependent methyltransferase [Choanephora cucurbitarum]|nr:S-adenosyl-L-methionine-dependent methyltransferase [Choanephora cucurbitarum]